MNSSDNEGSLCSIRIIASFLTRRIEHSVIAVAVAMRSGCPARHPSPKKSPPLKIATTASFPQRGRDAGGSGGCARRGLTEGRDEDDRERRVVCRQPLLEREARHSFQGDVEDQARGLGERG